MISAVVREWSWPDPIENVPALLEALRAGFELVQLAPTVDHRAANFNLFRDGHPAPPHVLFASTVAIRAIDQGSVERAELLEDHSVVYRATLRKAPRT